MDVAEHHPRRPASFHRAYPYPREAGRTGQKERRSPPVVQRAGTGHGATSEGAGHDVCCNRSRDRRAAGYGCALVFLISHEPISDNSPRAGGSPQSKGKGAETWRASPPEHQVQDNDEAAARPQICPTAHALEPRRVPAPPSPPLTRRGPLAARRARARPPDYTTVPVPAPRTVPERSALVAGLPNQINAKYPEQK
jgi:hypothetical protein